MDGQSQDEQQQQGEQKFNPPVNYVYLYKGCLFFALFFNSIALLSIPLQIGPNQSYLVQTQFNGNLKQGRLNGVINVTDLSYIRLGIWGACYKYANHASCLKLGVGYSVTIARDNPADSRMVVLPILTALLTAQTLAIFFSLLAFVISLFNYYLIWVEGLALLLTIVAVATQFGLWTYVRNAMQFYGGGVRTTLGPAFVLPILAGCLLLGIFTWQLTHNHVEDEKKKDKDKEEAKMNKNYLLQSGKVDFRYIESGIPKFNA